MRQENSYVKYEKILEFSQFFDDQNDFDLIDTLKKYSRKGLIRACHILGMNYGEAYFPDPKNPFFSPESFKYYDEIVSRYKKLPKGQQRKFCYCTPKTALELMRIIFDIPQDEFRGSGDMSDLEYDLFRVLLKINENLMSYTVNKNRDRASMTYFHLFVMNDFERDIKYIYNNQLNYYLPFADFFENDERCVVAKEKFFSKVGITSMSQYFMTWYGLVALVLDSLKKREKGCHILDASEYDDNIKSVFQYLSFSIDAVIPKKTEDKSDRNDNVDYRFFRAHPLIELEREKYQLFSFPILLERLYNGLFFDIKEHFGKEAFSFYNYEFVEKKLFRPHMWKSTGLHSSYYFPRKNESDEVEEYKNQPDFYIREGSNIILFECKSIKLGGELKDNRDIDNFFEILKSKLFLSEKNIDPNRHEKNKPENVGVMQLITQMKSIDDDTCPWDKNIPDEVSYYPVLVLDDIRLIIPGIVEIINSWYDPVVKVELPGQICNPMIVMSIDILINYCHVFKENGFRKIFDFYINEEIEQRKSISEGGGLIVDFDSFMLKRYSKSKKRIDERNDKIRQLYWLTEEPYI